MTVYHFDYSEYKSGVCKDLGSCDFELHIVESDEFGFREASDLFDEYVWYVHECYMEGSYEIVKHGIDEDAVGAVEYIDTFAPMSFEDYVEFKKGTRGVKNRDAVKDFD